MANMLADTAVLCTKYVVHFYELSRFRSENGSHTGVAVLYFQQIHPTPGYAK